MRLFENNSQYTWESDVSEALKTMTPEELAAIGWSIVEDTPRPADTATTSYDLAVENIDGVLKVVWVERPKTNTELIRDGISSQIETLNALLGVSGVADLSTLRGIKAATNAEINANPAKYLKSLVNIVIELIKAERRLSRMIGSRFESAE